jgi:hypothetical protein
MTQPNDYPIELCMKSVKPYLDNGCHFHQKFSCTKCGSRQAIEEQDKFFAEGKCEECGHVTDIKSRGCNFAIIGPPDVVTSIMAANAPVEHVMRVTGFANGEACLIAGEWLKTFDFNAHDGGGFGDFTDDPTQAQRFGSLQKAMDFHNTVSTVRPLRSDGLPNRPLTACTMVIEPLRDAIKAKGRHK